MRVGREKGRDRETRIETSERARREQEESKWREGGNDGRKKQKGRRETRGRKAMRESGEMEG